MLIILLLLENYSFCRTCQICSSLELEALSLVYCPKALFSPPSSGFARLSLVDQMSLLQSGWMEALLVGVAWRSQATLGEELAFAENLRLNEAQCRAAGLAELYTALRHLTAKYGALSLSAEEAVALKAVALANSGTAAVAQIKAFQS